MSIKNNVIANLIGNGWVGALTLLSVPIYIRYVGLDGYGAISVFATMLIIAFLLDLGISTAINKEIASRDTQGGDHLTLVNLSRTLEVIYLAIGLLVGLAIVLSAPYLSNHWFSGAGHHGRIPASIIALMGLSITCRWPVNFYSGGLSGMQKQIQLNLIAAALETVRTLGCIGIVILNGQLELFFGWYALSSLAGTAYLRRTFWRLLSPDGATGAFDLQLTRKVRRFAGGMSGIGILVTILVQSDKVVLSRILPLDQFGTYAAAGTLAASLHLLARPIFQALFPAFSNYIHCGNHDAQHRLFRLASQILAAVIIPVAFTLIVFALPLMTMWTGAIAAAEQSHAALALLAAGSAINCLLNVPYALQLAHGWTSLAFYCNLVAVILLIPGIIILANIWGMTGCALAWLAVNIGYMGVGISFMHARGVLPGGPWRFYRDVVLIPCAVCLPVVFLIHWLHARFIPPGNLALVISLGIAVCLGALLCALALADCRSEILLRLRRLRHMLAHAH